MIIVNKGYNVNDNNLFNTNDKDYSLYTGLNFIPNPAVYENISEDESSVRLQKMFFESYPEIKEILVNYFEWSVDLLNFYPIDPTNLVVKGTDGVEKGLTLFDCFHIYEVIIKPKDELLESLYTTYDVPQNMRVSWSYNKEVPSYSYKYLVQWLCNPLNIKKLADRLSEDEISFYRVWGGGLKQ